MEEYIFVDSNMLVYLGKQQYNFGDPALDSLLTPLSRLVITSTIYEEVTTGPFPEIPTIQDWLDQGIASGSIILESTPQYFGPDAGEDSLRFAATEYYSLLPVFFVSNDKRFLASDNFSPSLLTNQRLYNPQTWLLKSLFDGGISVAEYVINSQSIKEYGGGDPILKPGQTIVGSNGIIVDLTDPLNPVIIGSDGSILNLSPFDRFIEKQDGTAERIGRFDPYTQQFIPLELLEDFCFGGDVQVLRGDGVSVPISEIGLQTQVLAFDVADQLGRSELEANRVIRLHQRENALACDFHGVTVTSGHVFLTESGKFSSLWSILSNDGSVVDSRGVRVRARTAYPVGSEEDELYNVGYQRADGAVDVGLMRLGQAFAVRSGVYYSLGAYMSEQGCSPDGNGRFVNAKGDTVTAFWPGEEEPHPAFFAERYAPYPRDTPFRVSLGLPISFPEELWDEAAEANVVRDAAE